MRSKISWQEICIPKITEVVLIAVGSGQLIRISVSVSLCGTLGSGHHQPLQNTVSCQGD